MDTNENRPETITVRCEQCRELHTGSPHHDDRYTGVALYGITCPYDGLTDFFNAWQSV